MKLSEFLKENEISPEDFAVKIGVSRQAVFWYTTDKRVPKREIMRMIAKETGGAVMANDFM